MVEAVRKGEDVRMPDGSPVHMYRPFAGDQYGEWSVVIVREQVGLPSIRLSPDYGAPSPLWPSSDETDAMVPEELLAKLIGWQREFESHVHWETGWRSDEVKRRWAEQAAVLEVDVRVALEGRADLTVDLWPLEPS